MHGNQESEGHYMKMRITERRGNKEHESYKCKNRIRLGNEGLDAGGKVKG